MLVVGTCWIACNYNGARLSAVFTKYFEEFIAIRLRKTKTIDKFDRAKVGELLAADEHTLVQFFRKQIPCKCLDERYKEVKSIPKMGMCFNIDCPLPDQRAVRSKMAIAHDVVWRIIARGSAMRLVANHTRTIVRR